MPRKPKSTPETAIKDLIRTEIERQDHSLREAAKNAGLKSHLTLIRWLSGSRSIKADSLAKLLDYLGIELKATR